MNATPQQLDFDLARFTPPPAARATTHAASGSETSRIAAEKIARSTTRGEKMREVARIIHTAGAYGRTRYELHEMTGYPLQSICSIVGGLMATTYKGKQRDPEIMVADHTRLSPYGHEVEVLVTYVPDGAAEDRRP